MARVIWHAGALSVSSRCGSRLGQSGWCVLRSHEVGAFGSADLHDDGREVLVASRSTSCWHEVPKTPAGAPQRFPGASGSG